MILQMFIVLFFVNNVEKNLTFTFLCDTISILDNKERFIKKWIWKKLDFYLLVWYNIGKIIKKDLEKNEYEKYLTFIILYDII